MVQKCLLGDKISIGECSVETGDGCGIRLAK